MERWAVDHCICDNRLVNDDMRIPGLRASKITVHKFLNVCSSLHKTVCYDFLKSTRTKSKGMVRQGGMIHNLSDTDKF
jgi:hypothetical protein